MAYQEEEADPKKEVREWTSIESLKDSQLSDLIRDIRELELQKKDLEKRIARNRDLVAPLVTGHLGYAIGVRFPRLPGEKEREETARVDFFPSKESPGSLDEKKMIRDGVTPDQLARWRGEPQTKKAYFRISKWTPEPSSATSSGGSPTSLESKS